MAYIATKHFSYWAQLGILLGMTLGGFIAGGLISMIPLLLKLNLTDLFRQSPGGMMDAILKPEYANLLRLVQFISTLFLFCLPAWFYARICHRFPSTHLGLNKKPNLPQILIVGAIIFFSLFIIGALQEIWHQLPFPKNWLASFKEAENEYNRQVIVMARMNGPVDLILSLLVIALLPAIFEELFFRGALQNLFSRWLKAPVWSIIITAIIFSAIHGSYEGFLARFLLGFILGWLFYRTGNIWLNITAHFINNAIGVFALYFLSITNKTPDLSKLDERYPIWLGAIGVVSVIGLLFLFEKINFHKDRPGLEVILMGYEKPDNPSWTDVNNLGESNSIS